MSKKSTLAAAGRELERMRADLDVVYRVLAQLTISIALLREIDRTNQQWVPEATNLLRELLRIKLREVQK